MLPSLLACLSLVAPQEDAPPSPTPFDRVVELELTADDPHLLDERGPTAVVDHEIEFAGTLHVWTRSALDLALRVDDANEWTTLAEDDDAGGGKTPYLRMIVKPGDRLAVLIASSRPDELGPFELHLVAAPETEATLEAARAGRARLAEGRRRQLAGDRDEARVLLEEALGLLTGVPSATHSESVADVLRDLGFPAHELGQLESCRRARSAARDHRERTLPADHPELLVARQNLAVTIGQLGDLAGARALKESVLEARERTLPADHAELLSARGNLAVTMWQMGDLAGARALQESVLATRERTLPADHPGLLDARGNLALTLWELGDLAGARALQESVVAARERMLPADHHDLLIDRGNLAGTLRELGDLSGARTLFEAVLAGYERTLPADHPDLLDARQNLALTLWQQGELAGACALQESVVAARERTLPADHPDLLDARGNLALERWQMGDRVGARTLVPAQVAGMRALVLGSLALAPRQSRETVGAEAQRLAGALFLTRTADAGLQVPLFELQETMRMVAGEAARALNGAEDPEIQALLAQAGSVRGALNGLVSSASAARNPDEIASELTRLLKERDRLEREASLRLSERGVLTRPIEVGPLVEALAGEAALVAYRRIARWEQDEESERVVRGREHLQAHVLSSEGALMRIDLGEALELEELVAAWRRALGAPLLRGVSHVPREEQGERETAAGEALRARILDPILAELGEETRRLYVCADDLVFLVPLDALPLDGGHVGDRWSIANEVSLARLQVPAAPSEVAPGLLAFGGVHYDGPGADETVVTVASTSRSALPSRFARLLQTRFEAETTAALFEDLLAIEPVVLTKAQTTKQALFEHAPGKRYVHLATHGWFAPETMRSTLDEVPGDRDWSRTGVQEHVTGMAPMLLCGLALAGANQPTNSLGRRPGILTAEELCSLDLSACDLAVLSACETNVGIRRAGQGIQSLQAALYAAGARSSITSLWKVDDAATRRLMELFYTKLWEEGQPKAQALWEAKRVLRDEGAPVRDWAGWVLTGNPD